MLGDHIGLHAGVDLVTSVPASEGRPDRFAAYRGIAAESFGASERLVLSEVRPVGPLRYSSHTTRAALNVGRFKANPDIDGLHVLVLDDVITSG